MARVIWLPEAYEDLDELQAYISRDRPRAAKTLAERIIASTRQLGSFPNAGRVVPEMRQQSLREVIVRDYRVIYRVTDDAVHILAVRHGAMLLGDIPGL